MKKRIIENPELAEVKKASYIDDETWRALALRLKAKIPLKSKDRDSYLAAYLFMVIGCNHGNRLADFEHVRWDEIHVVSLDELNCRGLLIQPKTSKLDVFAVNVKKWAMLVCENQTDQIMDPVEISKRKNC